MKKNKEVGFEVGLKGNLITQFIDFNHPMAVAYERCIGYAKDYHVHDRLTLSFPRASSIIEFSIKGANGKNEIEKMIVDETSFHWMPAFVEHRQDTKSTVYDNLAIFPSEEAIQRAAEIFSNRYRIEMKVPQTTFVKKRSVILNLLLKDFFLERILDRKDPKYLENLSDLILDEVLKSFGVPRRENDDSIELFLEADEKDKTNSVHRAIRYMEENLFGQFESQAIAEYARTSPATLFRQFKKQVGLTPREYLTQRRLDESLSLLKSGEYTITDVAHIVGYGDLAAFSKAFKSYFRKSPQQYYATFASSIASEMRSMR